MLTTECVNQPACRRPPENQGGSHSAGSEFHQAALWKKHTDRSTGQKCGGKSGFLSCSNTVRKMFPASFARGSPSPSKALTNRWAAFRWALTPVWLFSVGGAVLSWSSMTETNSLWWSDSSSDSGMSSVSPQHLSSSWQSERERGRDRKRKWTAQRMFNRGFGLIQCFLMLPCLCNTHHTLQIWQSSTVPQSLLKSLKYGTSSRMGEICKRKKHRLLWSCKRQEMPNQTSAWSYTNIQD